MNGATDSIRKEFERIILEKFPTADMRRAPDNDGYINNAVSWAYWGYLQREPSAEVTP